MTVRLRRAAGVACAVALLAALAAAGEAGAKGVAGEDEAAAAPGITVTGIGFGRRDALATDRAVADARRRASAVAAALGVGVGATEAVETPALTQFGEPRPCRGAAARRGCPQTVRAAAAVVTFAVAGAAPAAGGGRPVAASGGASVRLRAHDPDSSTAIKRALLAARHDATPRAAADAARRARLTALAAGLRLGALVSVAEERPPFYYGPAFYESALGSFGPGRFCGFARRPVIRRDPRTGAVHVVRRVRVRRCFSPVSYDLRFAVRYEAA